MSKANVRKPNIYCVLVFIRGIAKRKIRQTSRNFCTEYSYPPFGLASHISMPDIRNFVEKY